MCCVHEGKTGTDESAQELTQKNLQSPLLCLDLKSKSYQLMSIVLDQLATNPHQASCKLMNWYVIWFWANQSFCSSCDPAGYSLLPVSVWVYGVTSCGHAESWCPESECVALLQSLQWCAFWVFFLILWNLLTVRPSLGLLWLSTPTGFDTVFIILLLALHPR